MGFSFGFFNAKNMDRTYTAEDFTSYLSSIICNGVLDTYGDSFSVTVGTGTQIVIGTGKAWIDGHYFINDTPYTLDLTGDIVSTGSLGKNIYYVLYSNGNVLVRGSGEMYDYDLNSNLSPFFGNNEISSVVVNGSVTYIGDYIFGDCRNMQKITLPNTLTSIGAGAFMQGDGYANTVYGLTEITIPSKVTAIGENAFLSSAIKSLVIPASVTEIGKYAFRDCAALKSVTINNSVIGEFMFVNCSKLSSFTIGTKLKKIGSNVFNYCSDLETIIYNDTLAKWQEIEKGSNWDGRSAMEPAQSGLLKIQCTDGYMEYADGVWKEVKA